MVLTYFTMHDVHVFRVILYNLTKQFGFLLKLSTFLDGKTTLLKSVKKAGLVVELMLPVLSNSE